MLYNIKKGDVNVTIYFFNIDGIYTGNQQVDGDPTTYVLPAGSTLKDPPKIGEHQILKFIEGDWRIISDYRNVAACYIDHGFYAGEHVFVLGEIPSSDTILTSKPILNAFYKAKWSGTEWVEGLSKEEIALIILQTPKTPIEMANTIAELNAQLDQIRSDALATTNIVNEFMTFVLPLLGH